jgi:hypothetical protein
VIDHQDHWLRVRVTDLQEVPDHPGKVHGRPLLGHGHMTLPDQGFVDHEQVGGTTPLVFVVEAGRRAGFDRYGGLDFRDPLLVQFVEADDRASRIVGPGIDREDVLHRADKIGIGLWRDDPLLL